MTTLGGGEMVTPSLRLVRRIGAGGMGTVWVARHLGLNSEVVVKFITAEHTPNSEAVARFQREAAAAAEVRSPHVVQMLDHGISQQGLPYIAMELLEGEDLAARVERQRLTPGEIAGVVVQVARALTRAHERQIVHRDIKPENIFLCETGDEDAFVKVLDFGIAKVSKPDHFGHTATGAMLGTPYYMSPEQVMGARTIDFRSDLWSLGLVAFYAMTGAHAFDGETIGALSVMICNGEPPKPSQLDPTIPEAVDAWFAIACAKDPAQRFQSARAMAEALVSAAGGRAVARIQARSGSHPAIQPPPQVVVEAPKAPLHPTIDSAAPVLARSVDRLNSTTGPASVSSSTVDGLPKRRWILVPLAIAGVLVTGVVVVLASRGDPPSAPTQKPAAVGSSTEPAKGGGAAKPVEAEPAEHPDKKTDEPAPPAVPTSKVDATKPAAGKPTPTSSAKVSTATSTSSAAPASPSSSTSKPTPAKPKPTDEIIE